jgi:hypothetical protein
MSESVRIIPSFLLALVTSACVEPSAVDVVLPDPAGRQDVQEEVASGALEATLTELPTAYTECGGTPNDSMSTYTDDTSPNAIYSAPWKAETPGLALYQGTQHITNIGGNKVSHTFNTPGGWSSTISYGYRKMRNAGKAAIYYDGQFVDTISLYAPDNVYHCEFSLHDMNPGVHTVMVKVLNQKESVSGGTYVNVDYFRQYDF